MRAGEGIATSGRAVLSRATPRKRCQAGSQAIREPRPEGRAAGYRATRRHLTEASRRLPAAEKSQVAGSALHVLWTHPVYWRRGVGRLRHWAEACWTSACARPRQTVSPECQFCGTPGGEPVEVALPYGLAAWVFARCGGLRALLPPGRARGRLRGPAHAAPRPGEAVESLYDAGHLKLNDNGGQIT